MNIGDYVRFYNRSWTEIGQIAGEVEDSHLKVVKCRDGYYDLDNFIKSSPNIIDLIEVGDYVNGFEVLRIDDECNLYPKTLKCQYTNNTDYFDIFNENIRSVLTKEQFKSMEYKVKE